MPRGGVAGEVALPPPRLSAGLLPWAARGRRLVALGEVHARPCMVRLARDVLLEMASQGPRPLLAVEYFNSDQQGLLDEWLAGRLSWRGLVEEYRRGPEGFPLDVYRPLLEAAAGLGARIIGVMPPRSLASLVARGLEPPRRPRHPWSPSLYPGYARFLMPLFPRSGPMARIPLERLLEAQSFKDQWAAERLAPWLARGRVLLVMGWAHVEAPWGVPERGLALLGARRLLRSRAVLVAGARASGAEECLRGLRSYEGRARVVECLGEE